MARTWQAVAIGGKIDLKTGRTGLVHSVFDRAVNLSIGSDLWTILADDTRLSPFSVCLAVSGFPEAGLRRGAVVLAGGGCLWLDGVTIDGRTASVWSEPVWGGVSAGHAARLALANSRAGNVAWTGTPALVARTLHALTAGDPQELDSALATTVGRGPGLTPSGDDCLIGILAGLRLCPGIPDGPEIAARLAAALVPHLASTTDISRHLLWQASAGHFARPVLDLARALCCPTRDHDLETAVDRALGTGGTSGGDMCLGLTAALQLGQVSQRRHIP